MKTTYSDEYQVSPRVILRPGDTFRISGGPYWRLSDGTKVPMAVRGLCRFIRAQRRGKLVLLEARSAEGFTVLHVEGKRRRIDGALVPRPYKVRGRRRTPKPAAPPQPPKQAKKRKSPKKPRKKPPIRTA